MTLVSLKKKNNCLQLPKQKQQGLADEGSGDYEKFTPRYQHPYTISPSLHFKGTFPRLEARSNCSVLSYDPVYANSSASVRFLCVSLIGQ